MDTNQETNIVDQSVPVRPKVHISMSANLCPTDPAELAQCDSCQ